MLEQDVILNYNILYEIFLKFFNFRDRNKMYKENV